VSRLKCSVFIFVLVLVLLLVSTAAFAEEPVKEEDRWAGEAELGFVQTSGNTETTSLNGKLGVEYNRMRWLYGLNLETLFSKDSGETTAERYVGTIRSNYRITERGYVFGKARYEDDRFAGWDYRISEVVGYGREVIKRDDLSLLLEGGPGMRHTKTTEGDREDEFIVLLAGRFAWKFSPNASLGEDLAVEIGEENTQTNSETWLKTTILGDFALKVALNVRNNSDPPPGAESTDSLFSVNLAYSF